MINVSRSVERPFDVLDLFSIAVTDRRRFGVRFPLDFQQPRPGPASGRASRSTL
jgi:hypothetical protein